MGNTTTIMRSNVRRAAPLIRSAIQFQRRSFSVCNARQAQYGFIGLGQMGYNMARNLQAKLPSTDTIRVYDINAESVDRFANDTKFVNWSFRAGCGYSSRSCRGLGNNYHRPPRTHPRQQCLRTNP